MSHHGLRAPRVSADVDILIEPARFHDACSLLESAGWRERPIPLINRRVSAHSQTYLHDDWPCDVDVHRHYPGLLADPAIVFDELWKRRVALSFAAVNVEIPDRASSLLLLALHSLRDGTVDRRHRTELGGLREVSLSEDERADLSELVAATGSGDSLGDVLPSLGIDLSHEQREASADHHTQALLREWQGRVASGSRGAYAWMVALRLAPWSERPRLLGQAIWPSNTDIRISHPEVSDMWWPLLRARGARLLRGLRGIPGSLNALNLRGKADG